jgi:hypothetical protein
VCISSKYISHLLAGAGTAGLLLKAKKATQNSFACVIVLLSIVSSPSI